MTVQLQKQKKKSFDHIFKWAEKQFAEMVELFTKKKSEIILETVRRLEKEGCEQSKISNEIITNLSGYVDDSYVRKILKEYPQYKDQKQQARAKSGRNIPAGTEGSEREPLEVPADKVKVEPTNKALPSPEMRTVEGIENDVDAVAEYQPLQQEELADVAEMAANILTLPENQKTDSKTQKQPPKQEINTNNFDIDKLHTYPVDYCREVIKELYDNNTDAIGRIKHWGSVNEDLRREVTELKKENEQYKRLPNNDALYNTIDLLKKENAELKRQLRGQQKQHQEFDEKQEWLLEK